MNYGTQVIDTFGIQTDSSCLLKYLFMKEPNGNRSEKATWILLKSGNKNAFNMIFKKYYSELYYYGIKIIPDQDIVKECLQEIFIRIWETRANLGDVENIKSYLLASFRRRILYQKEINKKRNTVEINRIEHTSFLFDVNEFEKHHEVSEETRQLLISAINSLTKKQRELVLLFFYHELSYPEIAQITGISIQAARNLMYRTLIHLRKSIKENSSQSKSYVLLMIFLSSIRKINGNN